MRHLVLLGLLVPSVGAAHPLVLYWSADYVASSGGWIYTFELVAEEDFTGNVDAILFADAGSAAPSDAETFVNYVQWGNTPAPFTEKAWIDTGTHVGPGFENHPATGWIPSGIGDSIRWQAFGINRIGVHNLYWSNLRGDLPLADYEPAVNTCAQLPTFELVEASCDGLDNDCDFQVDVIVDPPVADLHLGVCADARKVRGAEGFEEPDYLLIEGFEDVEITCDGLDNDCDGEVDEELDAPLAMFQDGVCAGVTQVCEGSDGWRQPYAEEVPDYERTETKCDGVDNDCDGTVDNAMECYRIDGGCHCGTGSALGGAALLPILAALGLRRRKTPPA